MSAVCQITWLSWLNFSSIRESSVCFLAALTSAYTLRDVETFAWPITSCMTLMFTSFSQRTTQYECPYGIIQTNGKTCIDSRILMFVLSFSVLFRSFCRRILLFWAFCRWFRSWIWQKRLFRSLGEVDLNLRFLFLFSFFK